MESNKMKNLSIIVLLSLISFAAANAGQPGSKQFGVDFNKMKTLAGDWQGKKDSGETVKVIYKVSSAGSSVIETLFPGEPHEMISVYTEVNGKVNMTHYCAMQNQPTLQLKSATKDTLDFDYINGTNLDAKKDPHMHHLTLKFKNKNAIEQHWTQFKGGKSAGINVFALTRSN
jgi:hypothetical protein